MATRTARRRANSNTDRQNKGLPILPILPAIIIVIGSLLAACINKYGLPWVSTASAPIQMTSISPSVTPKIDLIKPSFQNPSDAPQEDPKKLASQNNKTSFIEKPVTGRIGELKSNLKQKEAGNDNQARLNKYIDEYLEKYAGIDLGKHPCGDEIFAKQQRAARASLDMIHALGQELGRKDVIEFVRKREPFGIQLSGSCQ